MAVPLTNPVWIYGDDDDTVPADRTSMASWGSGKALRLEMWDGVRHLRPGSRARVHAGSSEIQARAPSSKYQDRPEATNLWHIVSSFNAELRLE